jgi:hypothetical protein
VTATNTTAAGHAIVFPTGVNPPTASNLNFTPGSSVPNLVVVRIGSGGRVRIVNNAPGTTDYVADVAGYFADGTAPGPSGSRYQALPPARALDTRAGSVTADGQFAGIGAALANQTRNVTILGRPALGVPAGATAVVLNVTAVQPGAPGHLRVWPTGGAVPGVSNVNFVPGQIVPNLVVVGLGSGGAVSIVNSAVGSTHLVADVVGFFAPAPVASSTYTALTPDRILDSRNGTGGFATPWSGGQTRSVLARGVGGVPGSGVTAVALNVTVTNPTTAGHATVFPSDVVAVPTASNLNFVPGLTVPNMVKVKLGPDGRVKIFNSAGSTDFVVDVVGYYS